MRRGRRRRGAGGDRGAGGASARSRCRSSSARSPSRRRWPPASRRSSAAASASRGSSGSCRDTAPRRPGDAGDGASARSAAGRPPRRSVPAGSPTRPAPGPAPWSGGGPASCRSCWRSSPALYGRPRRDTRLDPVSELVLTILSQNTADVNSERAFEALRAAYPSDGPVTVHRVVAPDGTEAPPEGWGGRGLDAGSAPDWTAVEHAPPEELMDVIRPGGLAPRRRPASRPPCATSARRPAATTSTSWPAWSRAPPGTG